MAIRVAIVDDEQTIRDYLKKGFENTGNIVCSGAYPGGAEALASLPVDATDIVLMDIRMPEMSGIECTRRLKAIAPDLPVIILTGYATPQLFFESLLAGATGYLIKPISVTRCAAAIEEVIAGGSPLSREAARLLVESFHGLPESAQHHAPLTDREQQIMACLVKGFRDRQIGEDLGIQPATVHTHMERIFDKLGVVSRADAVIKYFRRQEPDQRG